MFLTDLICATPFFHLGVEGLILFCLMLLGFSVSPWQFVMAMIGGVFIDLDQFLSWRNAKDILVNRFWREQKSPSEPSKTPPDIFHTVWFFLLLLVPTFLRGWWLGPLSWLVHQVIDAPQYDPDYPHTHPVFFWNRSKKWQPTFLSWNYSKKEKWTDALSAALLMSLLVICPFGFAIMLILASSPSLLLFYLFSALLLSLLCLCIILLFYSIALFSLLGENFFLSNMGQASLAFCLFAFLSYWFVILPAL